MSFTVDDFNDLLRLLDQHPEWQAELRRQLLTEELLGLPALVRELAAAQIGLTHRLDALATRLEAVVDRIDALAGRVGNLDGEMFEWRYERRAHAYFQKVVRRLHVLDPSRLATLLDEAVDQGILTDEERDEVMLADVVLAGRRRDDGTEAYFVAEVSAGLGVDDVRRAVERAAILGKLGRPAVPIVAGRWINLDAEGYARTSGVWQVLDGRTVPPARP